MGAADKHLSKITATLQEGETIIASLAATITTTPKSQSGTVGGVLVLTDRRLVFSGNYLFTNDLHSIPLKQVTSIDLSNGLLLSHLVVSQPGAYERYLIQGQNRVEFVKTANNLLASVHATPAEAAPAVSTADELIKLADLRDRGILSDTEFAAAKAKALG